jgi:DNA polymerase elongation subunit (family B)
MVSLDIETAGLSGELYSIGVVGDSDERVFLVGEGDPKSSIEYCATERDALIALFAWLEQHDPDLIVGWNVVDFDLRFLEVKARSLGVPLRLGRGGESADILPPATARQQGIARIPGPRGVGRYSTASTRILGLRELLVRIRGAEIARPGEADPRHVEPVARNTPPVSG